MVRGSFYCPLPFYITTAPSHVVWWELHHPIFSSVLQRDPFYERSSRGCGRLLLIWGPSPTAVGRRWIKRQHSSLNGEEPSRQANAKGKKTPLFWGHYKGGIPVGYLSFDILALSSRHAKPCRCLRLGVKVKSSCYFSQVLHAKAAFSNIFVKKQTNRQTNKKPKQTNKKKTKQKNPQNKNKTKQNQSQTTRANKRKVTLWSDARQEGWTVHRLN